MGVGQGLALSSILLALYLMPFPYILENCLKNLNLRISISILLMMDFLLLRASLSNFQTLVFFVATISLPIFFHNLVF